MDTISLILSIVTTICSSVNIVIGFFYLIPIVVLPRFHHRNHFLTLNVCIANILCCLIWFPDDPLFRNGSTSHLRNLQTLFTLPVPLSFVLISVHRYCSLVYRKTSFFKTRRWICLCVAVQWTLGVLLSIPDLLNFAMVKPCSFFGSLKDRFHHRRFSRTTPFGNVIICSSSSSSFRRWFSSLVTRWFTFTFGRHRVEFNRKRSSRVDIRCVWVIEIFSFFDTSFSCWSFSLADGRRCICFRSSNITRRWICCSTGVWPPGAKLPRWSTWSICFCTITNWESSFERSVCGVVENRK